DQHRRHHALTAAHRHPVAVPQLRRLGIDVDARRHRHPAQRVAIRHRPAHDHEERAPPGRLRDDRPATGAQDDGAEARPGAETAKDDRTGMAGTEGSALRVLFAGGGTGGHVYPSLAVARALEDACQARGESLEMLYVGVHGRVDERIVPREGIAFRAIAAGQLRVASPLAFVRGLLLLARGTVQALGITRRFKPDAVFATGGYASVPVGIAARVLRRPLVVYLPDITPGWALRLLSRLATRMATTSDAALTHLPPGRARVVGYPVRPAFWDIDRDEARRRLGLPENAKVVLVTAGSLGARAINDAVIAALPRLVAHATIVHMTGAA